LTGVGIVVYMCTCTIQQQVLHKIIDIAGLSWVPQRLDARQSGF